MKGFDSPREVYKIQTSIVTMHPQRMIVFYNEKRDVIGELPLTQAVRRRMKG